MRVLQIVLLVAVMLVLTVLFVAFTSRDRSVLLGHKQSVNVNGMVRTYRVVAPSTSKATQIVIGLHGYTGNGRQFAYYTALHNAFDSATVVAYPDATAAIQRDKSGWNASFCCGSGWKNKVDDVEFIATLIDTLQTKYNVPSSKIFLVGFSNGAFMAQRVASERPELIGGVVAASGTIGTEAHTLQPIKPVPMLLTHGVLDERVMFAGGESPGDPEFNWKSYQQTVEQWRITNRCDPEPTIVSNGDQVTKTFLNCKAPLVAIEYLHNAHKWDGWRLLNVWAQKPRGSVRAADFLRSLDHP